MHNLRRVAGLPADYLSDIIAAKTGARRATLNASHNRVLARYRVLEAAYSRAGLGGVPQNAWAPLDQQALLHCYDSTVSALEDLKRQIRITQSENIRDVCAYCGIGPPSQCDHYLPKSKFPEFSVHAYNLVPCCGPCNGMKGETWLLNGSRTFLNFYVDSLPVAPMLETVATWSVRHGKLIPKMSFSLVRPMRFRRASFALIESHFRRLQLLERYRDQSNSEYLALRDTAQARSARSVVTLRNFLNGWIARRTLTLGPLHWKLSLYRTLIEHQPFLRDCLER